MTATCSRYLDVFRLLSMFCGDMFLQQAVTIMSLIRPVILRKPSSSMAAISPVLKNPSFVKTSFVAFGFLY